MDLAANEKPAVLGRDLIYIRIPILDGDGNDDQTLELAISVVTHLIRSGTKSLIACSAGMSRSPGVAAASIAIATNANPDDCIASIIATGPNDVSPILWHRIKIVYNQLIARWD